MASVVKRAPSKKANVRELITIRLLPGALKSIERAAGKQNKGAREFLREYIEERFDPRITT